MVSNSMERKQGGSEVGVAGAAAEYPAAPGVGPAAHGRSEDRSLSAGGNIMGNMVHVLEDLEIPDDELEFATSRSSGPGGQNVNKVNTRVTVLFDVERSAALSAAQREQLHLRLGGRISRAGVLRVVSQRHRTQLANRDAAVERLAHLLRDALSEKPERVPIKVPAAVKERRLEEKRRRSSIKRERSPTAELDE